MEVSKEEFLLQIDHLSKQLFARGYAYQSVLIRGAFNELLSHNISPQLGEIKVCSVKNYRAWAEDNGFELIRVMLDANPFSIYTHIFNGNFDNPFASRKSYIDRYFSQLNTDYYVVRARDAIINRFDALNRFDVFSASYDLVQDDRIWLRYLPGESIYKSVTPDLSKILIDFTGWYRIENIKNRCIFIGSHPNWGHWTFDNLVKIAIFEKLPDKADLKLVFGHLTDNQKACLTLLDIHQDQIIELNRETLPREPVRYHFDDLIYIPEVPRPAALKFLRSRFAAAEVPTPESQPEFVYISRRSQAPRHRIYNIDQVECFFRDKGFLIVDSLENVKTANLISLFRKAKVIVFTFGADIGNLAMCNEEAVGILLVPDGYLASQDKELIIPQEVKYLHGTGLPIVLVAGNSMSVGKNPNQADGLAAYPIEVLDKALERAMELSPS